MNGYKHAWQLMRTSATESIPTAVSGWCRENDRQRAREAGFIYHLVKPVDIEQLEQILGTQVNHAHTH